MMSDLTLIQATPEQVSSDLNGEAVILDLKSGIYYGLNPVGAKIWTLVQEPKTVAQIREVLLEEYEVAPEICHRELIALLYQMEASGLVEVKNEATA